MPRADQLLASSGVQKNEQARAGKQNAYSHYPCPDCSFTDFHITIIDILISSHRWTLRRGRRQYSKSLFERSVLPRIMYHVCAGQRNGKGRYVDDERQLQDSDIIDICGKAVVKTKTTAQDERSSSCIRCRAFWLTGSPEHPPSQTSAADASLPCAFSPIDSSSHSQTPARTPRPACRTSTPRPLRPPRRRLHREGSRLRPPFCPDFHSRSQPRACRVRSWSSAIEEGLRDA